MKNVITLTRREVLSVMVSPLAYGAAAVFLFISGLVFVSQFTRTKLVDIRTVVDPLGYVLPVLLAPILTMRLLAEERRMGTLEMLVTAPVRNAEVVLSKFAGVFLFYACMVAFTGIHVFAMLLYSDGAVDWGRFGSGYLGMLLIAALFLSFGLFVSSLFESPVMSALVAFISGLAVLMAGLLTASPIFLQGGISKDVFEFLLPFGHYRRFLAGVLDTRDVAYFVVLIAYFLFLATKSLEARKWH